VQNAAVMLLTTGSTHHETCSRHLILDLTYAAVAPGKLGQLTKGENRSRSVLDEQRSAEERSKTDLEL